MTLRDLGVALRRFWGLCVAIVALALGVALAAVVVPAERWASSTVLSVLPADEDTFDFGGAQAVQYLVPPVITRMESSSFEREVEQALDGGEGSIEIEATNEAGTGIIDVSVSALDPAVAERAAGIATQMVIADPLSDLISIAVLNPPQPAESLADARRWPLLGAALVLGLIAAVLVAAAAHRLRPRLPRAEGFRERYGHEVLGEIPRGHEEVGTVPQLFAQGGPSPVVEAFRKLEARLLARIVQTRQGEMRMSIAVTSWGEGEGKTTVTAGLAWALSSFGREVTAVDCDLRRPALHRRLDVSVYGGVADIADGAPLTTVCRTTELPSLDVIAAGRAGRHPAQLVNAALPRLLQELAGDTVLIDTPPMFTADTTSILGSVDAVLLVADVRKRTPEEIEEALAELSLAGTPVLGVVLNRVRAADDRGQGSYYYAKTPAHASPA